MRQDYLRGGGGGGGGAPLDGAGGGGGGAPALGGPAGGGGGALWTPPEMFKIPLSKMRFSNHDKRKIIYGRFNLSKRLFNQRLRKRCRHVHGTRMHSGHK